MVDRGVAHGRFQVLHLKHMEYLLAAKMRCRKLYIGITHPDITSYGAVSALDIHGTTKRDNPLTYIERYEMVEEAMLDFGVKREEFEIIPFPVSHPDILPQYLPADAVYYMNICGEWDEERKQILENMGMTVEVLFEKTPEEKGITSSALREMIADEKEWKVHVPKTVCDYIERHGIEQRIRQLQYVYAPPAE